MTTLMGGPGRARLELPPIEGVKAPLCARGTIGDGGGTRSRRMELDISLGAFAVSGADKGANAVLAASES